ncbi:MAG: fold, partial [Acidimicrobiaceae bacterium]
MTVFEDLPDAIVRLDADRRIIEANAAAGRLVGRAASEIAGQSLTEVFAPRARDGSPILADGWHSS